MPLYHSKAIIAQINFPLWIRGTEGDFYIHTNLKSPLPPLSKGGNSHHLKIVHRHILKCMAPSPCTLWVFAGIRVESATKLKEHRK